MDQAIIPNDTRIYFVITIDGIFRFSIAFRPFSRYMENVTPQLLLCICLPCDSIHKMSIQLNSLRISYATWLLLLCTHMQSQYKKARHSNDFEFCSLVPRNATCVSPPFLPLLLGFSTRYYDIPCLTYRNANNDCTHSKDNIPQNVTHKKSIFDQMWKNQCTLNFSGIL